MDDQNAPATKGDIHQVRDEIHQVRDEVHQVRDEMHQVRDELVETMRDVQTEMLKAFYSYAQSADLRMKDSETMTHGVRERLAVVESRITEIERRLNTPPAP